MTDDKNPGQKPDQSDDGLDAWFASNFGTGETPAPAEDSEPGPQSNAEFGQGAQGGAQAGTQTGAQGGAQTGAQGGAQQPTPPSQDPFANFPPPLTPPDLTLPPPAPQPGPPDPTLAAGRHSGEVHPPVAPPTAAQWPTQPEPNTQSVPATPPEPTAEVWPQTGVFPGFNAEPPAARMPSEPTQAWPIPPVAAGLAGAPPEPSVPADPTEVFAQGEAIDRLFGESQFQEYEAEPLIGRMPSGSRQRPARPALTGAGIGKTQKILMWVAGGLVAALALVVLFYFGTKLPGLLGPSPVDVALPTNTPTPTPTTKPVGPLPPGEYRWDQLLGGECLDPYNGPWVEKFTVVDCSQPHPAQLVARGEFTGDDGFNTPYPGMDSLQAQATGLLCTSATVIDYAKASVYTDIEYEASFAVNATDWAKGDRDYYCFVSRSSGGAISGSLSVPPPVETTAPEPEE